MTIIRLAVAGVLLAATSLLSARAGGAAARAQAVPTVTLTVNLELATPVPPTATFSAFIGTSARPLEVVLCGTGRGAGRITYCTAGLTITQRTPIAATDTVPYRFVLFTGPYGLGHHSVTIAQGTVNLTRDATISAAYPRAAGTVPVTFRLRLHGVIPAREYFGVDYPRGGSSPEDLPLCASAAAFIVHAPGGYQRLCARGPLHRDRPRAARQPRPLGLLPLPDDARAHRAIARGLHARRPAGEPGDRGRCLLHFQRLA